MNTYLLAFDDSIVSRDEVIKDVDDLDGVENWLAFLPSVLCLVSSRSAQEISAGLNSKRPSTPFVIAPFDTIEADGRLPAVVWDFLNHPKPVDSRTVPLSATGT